MTTLTIVQIENAINYWRMKQPSVDEITLSKEVSSLANVYGEMILDRAETVEVSTLSDRQWGAIQVALKAFDGER